MNPTSVQLDLCPYCLRFDGRAEAVIDGTRFCPECGADWQSLAPLDGLDDDRVALPSGMVDATVPSGMAALLVSEGDPTVPSGMQAVAMLPRLAERSPAPRLVERTPPPRQAEVLTEALPALPAREVRRPSPRPPAWVVLAAVLTMLAGGVGVGALYGRFAEPRDAVEAATPVLAPAQVEAIAAPAPAPVTAPPPAAGTPPVVPPGPTPATVRAALDRALSTLPSGTEAQVDVRVEGHVAFLGGTTNTAEAVEAITSAAGAVDGVRAVDVRGLRLAGRRHVVLPGDSLYELAERYYGDGNRWRSIWRVNERPDPMNLEVGRALQIPPEAQAIVTPGSR